MKYLTLSLLVLIGCTPEPEPLQAQGYLPTIAVSIGIAASESPTIEIDEAIGALAPAYSWLVSKIEPPAGGVPQGIPLPPVGAVITPPPMPTLPLSGQVDSGRDGSESTKAVEWLTVAEAVRRSEKDGKPILFHCSQDNCPPCRTVEGLHKTLDVCRILNRYHAVRLTREKHPRTMVALRVVSYPTDVVRIDGMDTHLPQTVQAGAYLANLEAAASVTLEE